MREIKFRAWDTVTGKDKMVSWEELQEFPVNCVFLMPNREVTMMQFTGLKDKNRKKIYEHPKLKFIIENGLSEKDMENDI